MFTDVQTLNFELLPGSPAIDAGDPQHNLDPDGTRTDMGANYSFSPDDYPFDFTPTVVINEVLANSGDSPDWLELHNRSAEDIDISGWFLSDGRSNLKKYRIPADTIIEAGAFLTFTEDLHFGEDSPDPGRLEGFALSDTGETLYLSSGFGDQLTSYRFEEDFGPSFEGQTIGFHYKISSDSYDFVIMETATPNASNAPPLVGPIVISEIMYESDIEYLELVNISSESVNLYDSERAAGWRIDQGIQYDFLSSIAPLAPGERLILTENLATFTAQYQPESDRTVLQWTSGKLNNGGEVIQLERPGPLSKLGTRTFVRVDRVNYDDDEPWDTKAKENGLALAKINENEYGNDFINWEAAEASPLNSTLPKTYAEWAASWNISSNTPDEDLDKDNISNLFEYAFGMDPTTYDDKLKSPSLRVPIVQT